LDDNHTKLKKFPFDRYRTRANEERSYVRMDVYGRFISKIFDDDADEDDVYWYPTLLPDDTDEEIIVTKKVVITCLVKQFPELQKQFNDPRSITQAFCEKTRQILWYAQISPSETQRKRNKLQPSDENLPKWKLYNKNKIRENFKKFYKCDPATAIIINEDQPHPRDSDNQDDIKFDNTLYMFDPLPPKESINESQDEEDDETQMIDKPIEPADIDEDKGKYSKQNTPRMEKTTPPIAKSTSKKKLIKKRSKRKISSDGDRNSPNKKAKKDEKANNLDETEESHRSKEDEDDND